MIRQAFLSFEKRKILGEEGVSNIYKFLCGWLSSQNISDVTRKCERFLIVSFFLNSLTTMVAARTVADMQSLFFELHDR